jgi:hypothetical protein
VALDRYAGRCAIRVAIPGFLLALVAQGFIILAVRLLFPELW